MCSKQLYTLKLVIPYSCGLQQQKEKNVGSVLNKYNGKFR